jgi:hypothetical protein
MNKFILYGGKFFIFTCILNAMMFAILKEWNRVTAAILSAWFVEYYLTKFKKK